MKLVRLLLGVCSVTYFLILCIVCSGLFWPSKLYWLAGLIEMSPLWALCLPPSILVAVTILARMKKIALVNIISCVVIIFFVMGFNIPFSTIGQKRTDTKQFLRIVSCNLGTHVDKRLLSEFISESQPDVISFQEAYVDNQGVIEKILSRDKWYLSFEGDLGIASRLKIVDTEIIKRNIVGGWGELAARYTLDGNAGNIYLFNIHLKTPRVGIEAVKDEGLAGISTMRKVTELQNKESLILSAWIAPHKNVLIAGDFNLSQVNPIYNRYWSNFTNAFSCRGFGFGHTRFTRWHGVRIDHILSDGNWKVTHSEVGPDVGSDHRPMIADIEFIGAVSKANETAKVTQEKLPEQEALANENFEISLGRFENNKTAVITIDNETKYQGKNSLKVQPLDGENDLSIGIRLNTWRLNTYPVVSFAYKIPKGILVGLRVKTIYNDWVILAQTSTNQLIDDGQWHETSIDVRRAIRTVLPKVKMLKGLEFFSDTKAQTARAFWISQFRIVSNPIRNPELFVESRGRRQSI